MKFSGFVLAVFAVALSACRTVAPAQVAVPMAQADTFAVGATSAASMSLVAATDLNNNDVWASPVVAIAGAYVTVRALPPEAPVAAEVTATVGLGVESLGPAFGPGGSIGVRFWSRSDVTGIPIGLEAKVGAAADVGYGNGTLEYIWLQPELRALVSHRISETVAIGARPGVQIQRLVTKSPRDVTYIVVDVPIGAVWRFGSLNLGFEGAVSVAGLTPSARVGGQVEYCW